MNNNKGPKSFMNRMKGKQVATKKDADLKFKVTVEVSKMGQVSIIHPDVDNNTGIAAIIDALATGIKIIAQKKVANLPSEECSRIVMPPPGLKLDG